MPSGWGLCFWGIWSGVILISFMRVYKTLSIATEMMKNTWKRVLKNNQSYLSDPEKQKVLRFAMQRPALYLNELEACMEQILAETLEEAERTA